MMTLSKYFMAAGLVVFWAGAALAANVTLDKTAGGEGAGVHSWDVVYDPAGETGIASLQQNIGVDPNNDNVSDVSGTDSGNPAWGVPGFADLGAEIIFGGLNFEGDLPTPGTVVLGSFSVTWNGQGTVSIENTFSEFKAGQPAVDLPNTTEMELALLEEIMVSEEPLPLVKAEQKCVNTSNKNAQKVADAQGKNYASCIKDFAKGKNPSADICTAADAKGKFSKAASKYISKTGKDCGSGSGFMNIPLDPIVIAAAKDKELATLEMIFGTDGAIDGAIIKEADNKGDSKCQQAIVKAVFKCQATKWKEYNKCKKNKIKGKDTTQAGTAKEVQDACLGTGSGSIPDAKGKIAKKCGFSSTLTKKCSSNVFPGCPGDNTALNNCLDASIECQFCQAINAIDGLNRDCDLFDDGQSNGSCP